ncbi:MAG: DMT family transporter [Bacteroidales bacterium]|nr:DMT family transporter [Bacteroidales bacterium]
MTSLQIKGHTAMLGANVMWGLMSPLSKMVIVGGIVTPLVITNLRMAGAMVLFWITSLFVPREHVPLPDLARLFCAGMLGVLINQSCFMMGVGLTSPGDASIITTSMPLWVMILAALILKEPITAKKVGGIVCGATGALLLILSSGHVGADRASGIWGDLLVLTAQFSYALYLTLYKNFVARYSLVTLMKWMFTFAFLVNFCYAAPSLYSTVWSALSWAEIGSLAFTVVCGTYIAYVLIMIGQKTLRPTVVGMYNYFQPIVACMVGIYMGLDTFNLEKLAAILLIFCGVWLVTRSKSRSQMLAEQSQQQKTINKYGTKAAFRN